MDPRKICSYFGGFRRERMDRFIQLCRPTAETTILDVGGFSAFWRDSGVTAQITILRLDGAEILPPGTPSNIRSIDGDGCDLREHADKSFDLVFSNSVIEHVGDWERQCAFARSAMRVGRRVWAQTPAFEFPLEPHVLTPFFHWLPKATQEKLLPWTVWALIQRPPPPVLLRPTSTCAPASCRVGKCGAFFPAHSSSRNDSAACRRATSPISLRSDSCLYGAADSARPVMGTKLTGSTARSSRRPLTFSRTCRRCAP